MADKTNLDGKKLKAALDEFAEVGHRWRKHRIGKSLTMERKFVDFGVYFIAPIQLLLFLMMCGYGRQWRWNLGSEVISYQGVLQGFNPFLANPCSYTITYMDPDIAVKRLCQNTTEVHSCHCPADHESWIPILTSIVDMTTFSIMNSAIARFADPRPEVCGYWRCWEKSNVHYGLHSSNVTPIFNEHTAAGWVKLVMKL